MGSWLEGKEYENVQVVRSSVAVRVSKAQGLTETATGTFCCGGEFHHDKLNQNHRGEFCTFFWT